MGGGQDIWEAGEISTRMKVNAYSGKGGSGERNGGRRSVCLKCFELGGILICETH